MGIDRKPIDESWPTWANHVLAELKRLDSSIEKVENVNRASYKELKQDHYDMIEKTRKEIKDAIIELEKVRETVDEKQNTKISDIDKVISEIKLKTAIISSVFGFLCGLTPTVIMILYQVLTGVKK